LAAAAALALLLDEIICGAGFFVGTAGLFPQAAWLFLPFRAAVCCSFFFGLCVDGANTCTPAGMAAFFELAAVLFFQCIAGHLRWNPRLRLLLTIPMATAVNCLLLSTAVSWKITPSALTISLLLQSAFNCLMWRVFFWRNRRRRH
jgi:cell shape-determining protein MreD